MYLIIFFIVCILINFSINSTVTESLLYSMNNNCNITNGSSGHSPNYCKCNDGYVPSGDQTKCLKITTNFTGSCVESQQCSAFLHPGAICHDGMCICKAGYHYLHGKCWASSSLNKTCNEHSNCYTNFDIEAAVCKQHTCQCADGYYQREYRTCRRKAQKVGDSCEIDHDCIFISTNYKCDKKKGCILKANDTVQSLITEELSILKNINSKLRGVNDSHVCSRAHFYSSHEKKCVAEIGEACNDVEEPLIKNSICYNKHWKCKSGFVTTLDNRLCKKVTTEYNKSCLIDEQCYIFGPDALCKDKRCVCNENSHFIDEELFCWVYKRPNEKCIDDRDCFNVKSKINLLCTNETCQCPPETHVNSENICVPDVKALGDSCTELADCQPLPYTYCSNNVCSCKQNYFAESEQCVAGLNAHCNETFACKASNSYCQSGFCTCFDNYVASSNFNSCLPFSNYGEKCKFNEQCTATDDNLICQSSDICSCRPGYHYNYKKCFKQNFLGEHCEHIGECYVDSHYSSVICINDVCKCHPATQQINETYCKNQSTTIQLSNWILLTFTIAKLLL